MNKIENILKPKSKDEIITILCDKYDIPFNETEVDDLVNMYSIIRLISSDSPIRTLYYMGPTEVLNDFENDDVIKMMKISLQIYSQKVSPNLIVGNWSEIYQQLINLILRKTDASPFPEMIIKKDNLQIHHKQEIISRIFFGSNLIAKNVWMGPGNFVLINPELEKIFDTGHLNHLNVVKDKNLKNKIVIGRKNNENEPGIYLIKYKNKYIIKELGTDIYKNYVILDYELQ